MILSSICLKAVLIGFHQIIKNPPKKQPVNIDASWDYQKEGERKDLEYVKANIKKYSGWVVSFYEISRRVCVDDNFLFIL